MRLTVSQLRRIIKEEASRVMEMGMSVAGGQTNLVGAVEKLSNLLVNLGGKTKTPGIDRAVTELLAALDEVVGAGELPLEEELIQELYNALDDVLSGALRADDVDVTAPLSDLRRALGLRMIF